MKYMKFILIILTGFLLDDFNKFINEAWKYVWQILVKCITENAFIR